MPVIPATRRSKEEGLELVGCKSKVSPERGEAMVKGKWNTKPRVRREGCSLWAA